MYKPYSKLSEKEKIKLGLIRPKNLYLFDATDDDFDWPMQEDALLKYTIENLTKQLDKIEDIGLYTILMDKEYCPSIVFSNRQKYVLTKVSAVVKVVFGIDLAIQVCPEKVKRRKKHV